MKAPDLPLLTSVSRPTVHPAGVRAVVSATHPDFNSDDYVGQLWNVPLDGSGRSRRMTRGHRDTAPQFSPDGRLLAFLRAEPASPAQLYVVDADGGEPLQITNQSLGVTALEWSPDSVRLAFIARVPETGRYGTVPGLENEAEPPRRITTRRYQSNGVGYTIDRRPQVFLVTVPDVWGEPTPPTAPSPDSPARKAADEPDLLPGLPTARLLTIDGEEFDHAGLAFCPDGRTLVTISARHAGRDTDLRTGLVELDCGPVSTQGSPRMLLDESANLDINQVAWAPSGDLWFVAHDVGEDGRDFVGRSAALYRLPVRDSPVGVAAPERVTDPESSDLDDASPITTTDDGSVLVQSLARGRVQLTRISPNGDATLLAIGDLLVTGSHTRGGVTAYAFQDLTTAGDLALADSPAGIIRLTDFSAPLRETGVAPAVELTVPGRDGYPVHGWVLKPPGDGPHPVLLNIHGGPFAQYAVALFDEAQIYVDAGYAVVMCNPRGSRGYGQDHARSIRQRMGTVDQSDVLGFLDGALAGDDSLDGTRVGVMGGSYGGYLTAWIIAHDHRFAASIVERGFVDPEIIVGTSDIGDFFSDEYTGTDPDLVRSQSPQAVVQQVTTPTLLLHSEQDLRCPLSQAQRYYEVLQRRGVPTELVIFPGEDHELTRSGRPRHRLQRFEIVLDWWRRYLPV
ncbi:MAG TPA: S9 family peptidase [Glaciibacter sp.]|nr:S9 family peptidase [Glaciibacter sp.]